ncbi:MAG: hypothetical protein U5O69_04185 [Candidatus Competibacteraceae bacterium]|nr:hypothetical protein [Candidatus Competibacteraceae bacterium]
MPRRTQVSRADLLECLHAYGEAYLEGMASALGYVRTKNTAKKSGR